MSIITVFNFFSSIILPYRKPSLEEDASSESLCATHVLDKELAIFGADFEEYIPEQPGILSNAAHEIDISKIVFCQCCPVKKMLRIQDIHFG